VDLEISPEPTEDERAAIVEALSQDAENVSIPWEEEPSEP
jgi:hypothetical protein